MSGRAIACTGASCEYGGRGASARAPSPRAAAPSAASVRPLTGTRRDGSRAHAPGGAPPKERTSWLGRLASPRSSAPSAAAVEPIGPPPSMVRPAGTFGSAAVAASARRSMGENARQSAPPAAQRAAAAAAELRAEFRAMRAQHATSPGGGNNLAALSPKMVYSGHFAARDAYQSQLPQAAVLPAPGSHRDAPLSVLPPRSPGAPPPRSPTGAAGAELVNEFRALRQTSSSTRRQF